MSGTQAHPIGITNPPIDDLLTKADSKYALVIYGAKRARQVNAYYSQLQEGLLEHIGPLVDAQVHEKPLSIALREIDGGLLTKEAVVPGEEPAATSTPAAEQEAADLAEMVDLDAITGTGAAVDGDAELAPTDTPPADGPAPAN